MSLKVVLVLVAGLQLALSAETYDKVNLTYVYQARCPFCLEFVDEQLYSGYKTLSDYVNLELVLAVQVSDDGEIVCSHGENECFISKAQACVFQKPGITQALQVEYLHCTEAKAIAGGEVVEADIEKCVNSLPANIVSYETVKTCMNGEESTNILKEYSNTTFKKYDVTFVPWLGLFGKFDELTEEHLREDFVGTICSLLSNPPAVCNQ